MRVVESIAELQAGQSVSSKSRCPKASSAVGHLRIRGKDDPSARRPGAGKKPSPSPRSSVSSTEPRWPCWHAAARARTSTAGHPQWAPTMPPTMGATTYTIHTPGANTTLGSAPMTIAMMRGMMSRTGLKPASVIGPTVQMPMVMVRPMNSGKITSPGLPTLASSVIEKMMISRMHRKMPSPRAPCSTSMTRWGLFGYGSAQMVRAEAYVARSPKSVMSASSAATVGPKYSHRMNAATKAPRHWPIR